MPENANTQKLTIVLSIWKLFIEFFKCYLLAGVFLIPFVLILVLTTILEINWFPLSIYSYIQLVNPSDIPGSFTADGDTIIELFSPILLIFALVVAFIKWVIRKTTGINLTMSLKQKLLFLVTILTILHLTIAVIMANMSGDNLFYLVIGMFYIYSLVSTIIYLLLGFLIEKVDLIIERQMKAA